MKLDITENFFIKPKYKMDQWIKINMAQLGAIVQMLLVVQTKHCMLAINIITSLEYAEQKGYTKVWIEADS